MEKAKWVIRGHEGGQPPFFEEVLPGNLAESEVKRLLQRLVAKHLEPEEIVAASLRMNSGRYQPHFEMMREVCNGRLRLSSIGNPYYTATLEAHSLAGPQRRL